MPKRVKVTVTGAAGQIGYALLPRIASGQMFGNNCEIELQLLELESSLPALEGVAMELNDCAFPLLKKITCTADLKTAMEGTNWALLVGSVPRKLGMERSDLLQINGGIFTKQGQAINQYAAKDVRVFVIGNPCNTNCLIAQHHAPDVPKENFYALTALDELRARSQLADKAQVSIDAVKKMPIWGNHSATQVPDFYQAEINGQAAINIIDENWLKETLVPTVQQRGAAILKARGASSAMSAANAVIYGINQLINNTAKDDFYSMACYSKGEYQVDKGLIFSFPCQTINEKLTVVEGLTLNSYMQERFNQTLKELQQERDIVQSLGLLG